MHHSISITYVPTRTKKDVGYFFDQNSVYLKQDFLAGVEVEFLSIILSNIYNKHIPEHVIEAIIEYSNQHIIHRDITVVFDYSDE